MEVVKPERFFHERFGLSDRALERVLGTALGRRADWADLYFEFRVNQTASLEEGAVKKATRNVSQGVGVRVVAGARSGYAHSDEVSLERLELAARAAATIAEQRGAAIALPATRATAAAHDLYPVARQALTNLAAADAPAGTMTVVLGPGWPGVLLHEAIGHGLEGDFNRKRVSAFTDRVGTRVASEMCTVVDDGTIAERRGSLNVDDEGTPTQRTVLIERGILRGYLQDRLNAAAMRMTPTGNGRRESFAHLPMPRMTNTFMLAGEDAPEDVIRSVDGGLYAVYFGGGQVDITSGKFVFSASEAYLIEGGKVTRPVRGATLIGNGPDVLTRITRVGADLRLDEGIGTCGKDGQSVPVGVGLPTVRIDGLTVGGTQA